MDDPLENPQPDKPDYEAFLQDYRKLVLKHKIHISGCGCCGSPFTQRNYEAFDLESHIRHLRDS